jgi:hypothetical protein
MLGSNDLPLALFIIGTAIAVALALINKTGAPRSSRVCALFALGAACFLVATAWAAYGKLFS